MIQCQRLRFSSNKQFLINSQFSRGMCKTNKRYDVIEAADPVSNLRHIRYAVPENETPLEFELRKHREELQKWNEVFWTKHNINFVQKKHEFQEKELSKKGSGVQLLSADEMSVFYKKFLDENWKTHMKYLFQWYKKTLYVTFLHLQVNFQKLYTKK